MWLFLPVLVLVVAAVVGGAFAGGIYTIVLIPLAVIALFGAIVYGYFTGAAQRHAEQDRAPGRPAAPPTAQHDASAPAPSTPEELVDARRSNQ
jgi:flagellar basal body-associated protein FliL